jgi:hypothetical protein
MVHFVDVSVILDHHCLEVMVHFVDVSVIVDHHCLTFLFTTELKNNKRRNEFQKSISINLSEEKTNAGVSKWAGTRHIYLPHAQTAIYDSKVTLFLKQGISHQLGRDAIVRFECENSAIDVTQFSVISSNISMIIMYYEYMTTQYFVRFFLSI